MRTEKVITMVVVGFLLALAAGAAPEAAMRLANAAGGVAVMQRGPASVTGRDILDLIEREAQ